MATDQVWFRILLNHHSEVVKMWKTISREYYRIFRTAKGTRLWGAVAVGYQKLNAR